MQYIPFRYLSMIEEINQRTVQMALDLANLTAAETKLVADVDTLIEVVTAAQKQVADLQAQIAAGGAPDPATVAALDAITATLTSEDAKVVAASTPPAAPTGATGA